ncbi:hypothetical protein ROJ8625_03169 [Roseivivax jejudonensis]|uniref:DUF998 domain-containing protein n=1 Tax=Roseivivax jejudonensis TaxID=1529041 RepID=A0A1X6ZVC6_9RHOB|nr:DUF998 domain-containing protein [Roseivivax jejudonensis]SLN62873.1 hypothetical protein ROJ8625_03169 [Roseivivax jejudonensis]
MANEAQRRGHGLHPRAEMAEVVTHERPELLVLCGIAGILGSLGPVLTIVWAASVNQHDFVADTISDLARGPKAWIMDTGFYVHAAGLLGLSIAAAHAHLGRVGWSLGIFCLALLALNVTLLGIWDEFGATADSEGLSVHTKLSFGLGPLFLAGPLLMSQGARGIRNLYGNLFIASSVLWLAFAAAFKLSPNGYDGLFEKVAVVFTMLWTVPLGMMFTARGLERRHRLIG